MRLISRTARETRTLPAEFGGLAEEFHASIRNPSYSKWFYKAHETHYADWVQRLVREAPLHIEGVPRIALPDPDPGLLEMSVGRAIAARRSGRSYSATPLSPVQLSTLLYTAVGVRPTESGAAARGMLQRNVTNSGNLGSVEIYPIVFGVESIAPGIFHFDSVCHDLAVLHHGHFRRWMREVVLFQLEFAEAAVALVLTSAFGRLKAKYGPRGYRLGLFDIGHVSENLYLIATALGLEACATAGFIDEILDSTLNLDGLDTATSLVVLVGQPAEENAQTVSTRGLGFHPTR